MEVAWLGGVLREMGGTSFFSRGDGLIMEIKMTVQYVEDGKSW